MTKDQLIMTKWMNYVLIIYLPHDYINSNEYTHCMDQELYIKNPWCQLI